MVTVATSILTNDSYDMAVIGTVDFQSNLVATSTEFSWTAGRPDIVSTNTVSIFGSGLTYSGSGDSRELSGGTINRISLDKGGDNGAATHGDLVITGTEGLIAANIQKGSLQGFWNEILKGNDTFLLSGMAQVDIGLGSGLFFGDDYRSSADILGFNDGGGNDLMIGADNNFILIGDVYLLEGVDFRNLRLPSTYYGGNDQLISAVTDRAIALFGDADTVLADGTLHGGNDTLDNGKTTSLSSYAAGDAHYCFSYATVYGGDDTITLGTFGAGAGDVFVMLGTGGYIVGGDDVMTTSGHLACAGDVQGIDPTVVNGVIIGGDDQITGGNQDDQAAGDVFVRGSTSNTITGGDDLMIGGGGNDTFWGETAGSLVNVSGGNDTLVGGGGNDQLMGQTGDDILVGGNDDDTLQGGSGNDVLRGGKGDDRLNGNEDDDRLTGDAGADLFTFGLHSGVDRITDFTDTGGADDDRINLRAYDFADRADIVLSNSGDDLIIRLGAGNRIFVTDYLSTHAATDILNDILI